MALQSIATESVVLLEPMEVGGVKYPAGATVTMSVGAAERHAKVGRVQRSGTSAPAPVVVEEPVVEAPEEVQEEPAAPQESVEDAVVEEPVVEPAKPQGRAAKRLSRTKNQS